MYLMFSEAVIYTQHAHGVTGHLNNFALMPLQLHDTSSTLMGRCINIMCPFGSHVE